MGFLRLSGFMGSSLLVAASVFAIACSDDGNSNAMSSATPGTATASPQATTASQTDIRSVDLANQPDVKAFVQSLDGEVAPEEVIYSDLTGDGVEEAVVPVSSGGTQGDVGFIVVGFIDGKLKALLSDAPEGGEVRVAVMGGTLVETLPLYSDGDLPGFPSRVKSIFYVWEGDHFIVDHEVVSTGPNSPRQP